MMWATAWQNQQNECAPSEDSDQPGHPPSLIRVFAVRMKKPWVLSYPLSAQRRLWSDWADAQADLSLCWAHTHFVCFVMSQLMSQLMFFFLFFPKCHIETFCKPWKSNVPVPSGSASLTIVVISSSEISTPMFEHAFLRLSIEMTPSPVGSKTLKAALTILFWSHVVSCNRNRNSWNSTRPVSTNKCNDSRMSKYAKIWFDCVWHRCTWAGEENGQSS